MTYKQPALFALAVCALLWGPIACGPDDAKPHAAESETTRATKPPRCEAAKYSWSKPTRRVFLAGVSQPHVLGKGGGRFNDASRPVPHPDSKVTVEEGPDVDAAKVVGALDAYSDWGFLYGPGEIEPGRSDGSALSYEVRESGVYVQLKFGQLVEADFRRTCRGGVPTSRGHAVGIGAFGGSTLDCTETLHLKFLKDEDVSLGEATREGARAACPSGSRASRKS